MNSGWRRKCAGSGRKTSRFRDVQQLLSRLCRPNASTMRCLLGSPVVTLRSAGASDFGSETTETVRRDFPASCRIHRTGDKFKL
jgi:hypothetical protein